MLSHSTAGVGAACCPSPAQLPQPGVADSSQVMSFLSEAYGAYREVLADPCYESMKTRVAALTAHLQSKGLCGLASVQLLAAHRRHIHWESMGLEAFSCFYRFVFLLCREPGKRNLQVEVAVQAWQLVLRGRFRLLDKWCAFISAHQCYIITEDTWRQVLDFSRTVHEDLCNYDPSGAWPVLLDDFVDELRSQRGRAREEPATCPQALLQAWSGLGTAVRMTPMSPHSGSKRKAPDVEAVADQLQQMPLVSAASSGSGEMLALGSQQQQQQQQGDGNDRQHAGAGLRPTPLSAKRHRSLFGGARGGAFDSISSAGNAGGAASPMSLSPRGGQAPTSAASADMAPAQHTLLQPLLQQLPAQSAGLPQRYSHMPLPGVVPFFSQPQQQQQQQQQLLNKGIGSGFPALHPQALLHHDGCGLRGFDPGFAQRSSSVNAMMQVTVNEALGLN